MNLGINPFHLAQVSFGKNDYVGCPEEGECTIDDPAWREPISKDAFERTQRSTESVRTKNNDRFERTERCESSRECKEPVRSGCYRPTYEEPEVPYDDTFENQHGEPSLCVGECQ